MALIRCHSCFIASSNGESTDRTWARPCDHHRQLLRRDHQLAHAAAVDDQEAAGERADPGDPAGALVAVLVHQAQALADPQPAHARRDRRVERELGVAAGHAQHAVVLVGRLLRLRLVHGTGGVGQGQRGMMRAIASRARTRLLPQLA